VESYKKGFRLKNNTQKSVIMLLLSKGVYRNDSRVMREIEALSRQDFSITLITLSNTTKYTAETLKNGAKVISIPTIANRISGNAIFWFIKYIFWIVRIVKSVKHFSFKIVHANDLNTLLPAWILSRLHRSSLIYDSHELFLEQYHLNPVVKIIWNIIESLLIKRADSVFAENVKCSQYLMRRYHLEKVVPLYNMQWYRKYTPQNKFRQLFNISDECKIILYQGAIRPARGLEKLLIIAKEFPMYCIVVLGHGDYRTNLEDQSKKLKLTNFYTMSAVPKNQLHEYTCSADLGIFLLENVDLNYYYATSNKLFEYLGAGLPVVFSDFPEMRRFIKRYNTGFVVNENNISEIKDKVHRILENPKLWNIMHNNALNAIRTDLNWEKESKKLIDVYNKMVDLTNFRKNV